MFEPSPSDSWVRIYGCTQQDQWDKCILLISKLSSSVKSRVGTVPSLFSLDASWLPGGHFPLREYKVSGLCLYSWHSFNMDGVVTVFQIFLNEFWPLCCLLVCSVISERHRLLLIVLPSHSWLYLPLMLRRAAKHSIEAPPPPHTHHYTGLSYHDGCMCNVWPSLT